MARREKDPLQESEWMPTAEDSLLIRSAESLGRVIGSLQRELDKATRQLLKADGNGRRNGKGAAARKGKTVRRRVKTATKKTAARKAAARKK